MSFIISALIFIVLLIAAALTGRYFGKKARAANMLKCEQETEIEPSWYEEDQVTETVQEAIIVPEPEATDRIEPAVQTTPAEEIAPQTQAEELIAEIIEVPKMTSEEPITETASTATEVPETKPEEAAIETAEAETATQETEISEAGSANRAKSGGEAKEEKA